MTTQPCKADRYAGSLVRLTILDPENDSKDWARWNQNSEYQQLSNSGPATLWSPKLIQEWVEKHMDEVYLFTIRTLTNDQAIGDIDLSGIDWVTGNCWVGIGIGDQEYWGKGYGTEAMKLILRFAFEALNLRRVSLTVFSYNPRAYHSYLKAGFKEEGRQRQWMLRSGERHDLIFMGILRDEWEAMQNTESVRQESVRQESVRQESDRLEPDQQPSAAANHKAPEGNAP
jgi:RimJ/RimL family protein N-acetyltransferase